MNTNGPDWWEVNIGSGNGLILSGNKPLPEPDGPRSLTPQEITQTNVDIWPKQFCSIHLIFYS